jgi:hypothetical protein
MPNYFLGKAEFLGDFVGIGEKAMLFALIDCGVFQNGRYCGCN